MSNLTISINDDGNTYIIKKELSDIDWYDLLLKLQSVITSLQTTIKIQDPIKEIIKIEEEDCKCKEKRKLILPLDARIPEELSIQTSKKRIKKNYIRLSQEDWQVILDDLHNGRVKTMDIVKKFWIGQSTISVKYREYKEDRLRAHPIHKVPLKFNT